ncbi:MAG: type II/IV secretion system protein [Patescibacteria group bacterium]|nr:type II/IV secretion system protein [Patescibacteria group bacterium]
MIFLETLVKENILKEDQVPEVIKIANEKYNGSIDEALLDLNLDENQLLRIKSELFNIPIKDIDPTTVAQDTLKLIPADATKMYHFLPIGLTDSVLEIGILDPENIQANDAITFITAKLDKPYKLFLIKTSVYNKLLENYEGIDSQVDQALSELDTEIAGTKEDDVKIETNKKASDSLKPGEEEKIVEDAPIIKIVAVILRHATEGLASDIHIENVGDKIRVRFRVDGVMHTSLILPISVYNGVVARIKILAKLRLDEKRKPQDGGFSAKIDGRKIDFRVSTMPSYYGEKLEMRILDSEKGVQKLENLSMSPENLALVREAIARPYGLILITGPTGSGKTTTLYSMINELDHEAENIISLEDPVEYHMDGVNQSQVMPEIGYTFASGLRSILRQDPDIIMVGEIRDKETAELAIQAALTGHLVFSTLHTNTAIGAIPRLIDMGIDPYLIAPTLVLCIAQRLAHKIYPASKHAIPIDEATRIMLDKQFADLPKEYRDKLNIKDTIYESVPSPECPLGVRGRIPLFEMFKVDQEMQNIILKKPQEQEIYKLARSRGMLSLREDAIVKAIKGDVPLQEIYNY